ncbi:DUF6461 domain-containing protein [Actinomadura sp. SCN-SB]|uniref:DUF6461 domain-containing protein n=1 Tax=Actinomadura sp. SCN-SB TaxID=3373092 RepID=UPI003751125A
MVATAADYAWFERSFPRLAEAYCLTLVCGLSPPQVLARLGARTNGPHVTGIGGLSALDLDTADEQLIAVTVADGGDGGAWALAVEAGGRVGVTEEAVVALSAGTRLVAHQRDAGGSGRFTWAEDGDVRAAFDPNVPGRREGSTPDEPLEAMRAAGFGLDGDERRFHAAFALAENLTGVRVTSEILETSSFHCGLAPLP